MAKENGQFVIPRMTQREGWQGLLEHLKVPLSWIDWFDARKTAILSLLVAIVFVLVAWGVYGSYSSSKNRTAAELLAQAMAAPAADRKTALTALLSSHASTDAALWAGLELGHSAMMAGRTDEALDFYRQALKDAGGNPAAPLIQMALAQVLEEKGETGAALEVYVRLAAIPGFAREGQLGVARMQLKLGKTELARQAYENYLSEAKNADLTGGGDPRLREFVEHRLSGLKKEPAAGGEDGSSP